MSWLDDDHDWQLSFRYPSHALIGHTLAKNERLGVLLEFDDVVDAELDVFLRNIHVVNLWNNEREIRLFTHQVFAIGDSRSNTDTAQYLPQSEAELHYRGRRAFIISGIHSDSKEKFDQYTVGLFGIEGHEGSYRDADDGDLSFGNVEHGRVDSVLRFRLVIPAHSSARVHYWIAAGRSMKEAMVVHKQVEHDGLLKRLHKTADWWHRWLKPAIKVAHKIDPEHQDNFLHSMMIIKSQIDKRGAVIASTDTTMLNYSRDAYAYCWPRDGALTLWPLIRIGYQEEPRRFFEFCRRGLHEDGYLMHKYQADGAIGSSWHPYLHDGMYARPIQEDETASVLFIFSQFYHAHPSNDLLDEFYSTLVVPMANFMAQYIDPTTGLPSPSYDLWEEVLLTTTYTTAVTYAALEAAAELAEKAGDAENVVKWRSAADEIYQAAHKHLYNPNRKAFYKGIIVKNGEIVKDETIDMSSFFGAFIFGLFATDSPEVKAMHQTIIDTCGHEGAVTGVPRYENDNYQRSDPNIPPNWWFITSLWLAQYSSEIEQPVEAKRILDWVKDHASSTGVLSEQLHPHSEARTSVEPLTWSHAEYISALLDNIADEHTS